MRKFDWVGAGLISVAVTLGVGRAAIAGAPDRWETIKAMIGRVLNEDLVVPSVWVNNQR